jgi:lysyl-tRNA synthetase class 2
MKRLLAEEPGPIFQICKVFRNSGVSGHHNPEFTLLELYRPQADYRAVMADLRRLASAAEALGAPDPQDDIYQRHGARGMLQRRASISRPPDARALATAAARVGVQASADDGFDDVFFRLFLEKVEPRLGLECPCYLVDYPASMAALSRLKPEDPSVAERFELYARGMELANGFSELTDAVEQRRRLEGERAWRVAQGRPAYPLDERFLEAVGRMPPSGGVAVGLDRVLMLMLGARSIDEVLLFPAREFV